MKKYEKLTVEEEIITKVVCDCCKKEFDMQKDYMEVQEMLHINLLGGFNSIFGDTSKIECDLCQHCLDNLLGKYLRINKEIDEE